MNTGAANTSGGARDGEGTEVPNIPDHTLLRCIGRGSYGEVWLARTVLGEHRAVKIVYRSRFEHDRPYEREFEGIRKFEPISRSHESQVDILHVGRDDDGGCFYYVMELADDGGGESEQVGKGEREGGLISPTPSLTFSPATYQPHTLKLDLHRRSRLPVTECIDIGLSLCRALQHLHGHGLVHRDIKPSNIIFIEGIPKLADIGLVASMDATMSFVGTSGFVPPEGPGTPQGDIYSLGKVLYEISMGRDRTEFPKLPADLADSSDAKRLLELNAVIVKACHHDPQQRYASAQGMAVELELLREGQSVRSKRVGERRLVWVKKLSIAAAIIAVFATGVTLLLKRFNTSDPREMNSIAVLPFMNQGAPDQGMSSRLDYLATALADETINALSEAGLRVAPRSAVFAFKSRTNDVRQIGEQLRVRTILAGNIMKKSSNQLYIAARLINVADGTERWSATYDRYRSSTNVREVATELVTDVARVLKVSISDSALRQMETNFTHKLAAYKLYSQAITNAGNTQEGLDRSIQLLTKVIAEDPNYAPAHADLAYRYQEASGFYLPRGQASALARVSARRALDLDEALPRAHLALGYLYAGHDLNLAQAKVHFERAIELNPTNGAAYGDFAGVLCIYGQFTDAEQVLRRGDEVDSNSHNLLSGRCWRYYYGREFDKAKQAAHRLQARHPHSVMGPYHLALAAEGMRHYEEALDWAGKMRQIDPSPDTVSHVGRLHARLGHRPEAEKALEQIRLLAQSPGGGRSYAAEVLLALGETNRTIEHLQRAVEEYPPNALWLNASPLWDELRSDERFQALIKNMEWKK